MLTRWTAALGGFIARFEPFSREAERLANQRVWGRTDLPTYDFGAAKYVVSFGADFLEDVLAEVQMEAALDLNRSASSYP